MGWLALQYSNRRHQLAAKCYCTGILDSTGSKLSLSLVQDLNYQLKLYVPSKTSGRQKGS